jgi:predicted RNase H-like HicB family nuclease
MTADDFLQAKDLELVFHAKISTAFASGMSVIEISNLFRYSRIEFVHGALRDAKLIPLMSRKGPKHSYDIDSRLKREFDKRGYTFGRWCLGWGFDPVETAATLKEKPVEVVRPAHDAVRRDFPEAYFEIFGGTPPCKNSWQEKKVFPRLSLNIVWDASCKGYVASVPETPGIAAKGYNWANALDEMQSVQRLMRNIGLLESIIQNCGTSKDGR